MFVDKRDGDQQDRAEINWPELRYKTKANEGDQQQ